MSSLPVSDADRVLQAGQLVAFSLAQRPGGGEFTERFAQRRADGGVAVEERGPRGDHRIGALPTPPIELRDATQRLAAYVTHDSDLQHFAGNTLLHTDWNRSNVIIGDDARIVDWGWATQGAPWLDAAYWTIWLIAAGHSPETAEHHAAQIPSWHSASTAGLNAFAAANARLWTETGGDQPDPWTTRIAAAAQAWHGFRSTRP